jgi:hypothetical protein
VPAGLYVVDKTAPHTGAWCQDRSVGVLGVADSHDAGDIAGDFDAVAAGDSRQETETLMIEAMAAHIALLRQEGQPEPR